MSGMITRARAFSTEALKVVNNVAKQQYNVTLRGGREASLTYVQNGKNITFVTTYVPPEFQGKGVGKILAQYAFNHAFTQKLNVICKCHFLAKYYENNLHTFQGLNVKMELD